MRKPRNSKTSSFIGETIVNVADATGTILFVSHLSPVVRAKFGGRVSRAVGRKVWDFVAPAQRHAFTEVFASVLFTGKSRTVETVNIIGWPVSVAVHRYADGGSPRVAITVRYLARSGGGVLHPREAAVLQGLLRNQSNAEIGRRLGIRESTVSLYRSRAIKKLEANHIAGAIGRALAAGLIAPD